MNLPTHIFEEDLAWSNSQHNADWWEPYYRKAFPDLQRIDSVNGPCPAQRAGVDKFIVLTSGKKLAVDEKVRRIASPYDVALEYEHIRPDGTHWPGWIAKDNQFTDYLAYGFQKFKIAFFFPFASLRAAWLKNQNDWKDRFPIPPSRNDGYDTYNVAVPTEILMGYLLDAMRVQL